MSAAVVSARADPAGPDGPGSGSSDDIQLFMAGAGGEITLAEVGQDDDDQSSLALRPLGDLDSREGGGAARDSAEHPLLTRQPPRHLEGVLIADQDDVVDHLGVEDIRDESRADPLDL